jgi:hypothetical protein
LVASTWPVLSNLSFRFCSGHHAGENFRRDHVPELGPTIYVTNGVRVHIEFVIANRYVDMIYFDRGAGMSSVSNVQGYGFVRTLLSIDSDPDSDPVGSPCTLQSLSSTLRLTIVPCQQNLHPIAEQGRLITVEMAADVLSFRNIRYSINAGPNGMGDRCVSS